MDLGLQPRMVGSVRGYFTNTAQSAVLSHYISPGVLLALLVVLIATQVTRLIAPGRGAYLWTLALALLGLIVGELIAYSGHLQGPSLGVLHPIPDLLTMAIIETAGVFVTSPRSE